MQALQVRQQAGPAVGDLAADLGLVDELRVQDPFDGARGLRLDRCPHLGARQVGTEVGPGPACRGPAGDDECQEKQPEAPYPTHATLRNSRTPRTNTSS